ncbi:hypothetical protein ACQY0O_003712 [Thecaphora frezii]
MSVYPGPRQLSLSGHGNIVSSGANKAITLGINDEGFIIKADASDGYRILSFENDKLGLTYQEQKPEAAITLTDRPSIFAIRPYKGETEDGNEGPAVTIAPAGPNQQGGTLYLAGTSKPKTNDRQIYLVAQDASDIERAHWYLNPFVPEKDDEEYNEVDNEEDEHEDF